MHSQVFFAICALLAFYSGRSEAQIYAASYGVKTVNWVDLTNITWTDTPEIYSQSFWGIGVMRNYAGGPGWMLGTTSWNDASFADTWYVAWRTYSHGSRPGAGWYYSGGAHRFITLGMDYVTHPDSPSYGGIWVSPCQA